MISKIRIRNFLSFNDEVAISMLPSAVRKFEEHKSTPVGGISPLKTALIWGDCTSGKSNFVNAIAFMQNMVMLGSRYAGLRDYKKFLFAKDTNSTLSKLEIEFQKDNKNYDFGFEFNNDEIVNEWLYKFTKRSRKMIYERKDGMFSFDGLCGRNKSENSIPYILNFAKATSKNELFIHEVYSKDEMDNDSDLCNIIDWFSNTLTVISPNTPYKPGIMLQAANDNDLQSSYNNLLKSFKSCYAGGAGIHGVTLKDVEIEELNITYDLLQTIKADLQKADDRNVYGLLSSNGNQYLISVEDGLTKAKELMAVHYVKGSYEKETVVLPFSNEARGTRRMLENIHLLLSLARKPKDIVIDDADSNVTPDLVDNTFKCFFEMCSHENNQLIAMSTQIPPNILYTLRKDEIWKMVKSYYGETKLSHGFFL